MQALAQKIYVLQSANDELRKELFINKLRLAKIVTNLGFESVECLEEAIVPQSSAIGMRKCAGLRNRIQHGFGNETEVNNLDAGDLQEIAPKTRQKETVNTGKCDEELEKNLQAKFDLLSHKYSSLRNAHEGIIARYKDHYRRWKAFKFWLLDEVRGSNDSGGIEKLDQTALQDRLRKVFNEADSTCYARDVVSSANASPKKVRYEDLESSRSLFEGCYVDSNERSPAQEKSCKRLFALSPQKNHTSSCLGPGDFESSLNPQKINSVSARPGVMKINIEVSTNDDEKCLQDCKTFGNDYFRSAVAGERKGINLQQSPANLGSTKSKRSPQTIITEHTSSQTEKLYAHLDSGTAEAHVDGPIRSKAKRRRLNAGDCECCKNYYEQLDVSMGRQTGPLWISPERTQADATCSGHHTAHARKQKISRHRYQWTPPSTPPGYWTIAFPTTQEVEDINKSVNFREKS